jgi:hypothetical protein
VLVGRKPARVAGLGINLRDLTVLVREPEVPPSNADGDAAGMLVHLRLLARAIVDTHDLHAVVFELQLVVLGFHLGGVLCRGKIRSQAQNYSGEKTSAQHCGPPEPRAYSRLKKRYSRRGKPVNDSRMAAPKWLIVPQEEQLRPTGFGSGEGTSPSAESRKPTSRNYFF